MFIYLNLRNFNLFVLDSSPSRKALCPYALGECDRILLEWLHNLNRRRVTDISSS